MILIRYPAILSNENRSLPRHPLRHNQNHDQNHGSRWTYRSINQYDFRLHATRIIPLSLAIRPSWMGFVKGVDAQSDSRLNRSPNKGNGQFAYRFKGWSIFKPRFKRGVAVNGQPLLPLLLSIFQLCNENDYLFIQAHWLNAVTGLERSLFMLQQHGRAVSSQPRPELIIRHSNVFSFLSFSFLDKLIDRRQSCARDKNGIITARNRSMYARDE